MKFKSITARNKRTGWNIENMQFNPMLTLLVGASGVGKTKVLNVIKTLARIAKGESFNGLEWEVEFEQNGHDYLWEGEFEAKVILDEDILNTNEVEKEEVPIVREKILDNGICLVDRVSQSIVYNGQELVKLDNTKSVVELLKEEPSIKPIFEGFRQCHSLVTAGLISRLASRGSIYKESPMHIEQIKRLVTLSLFERLYLLRENRLKEFDLIVQTFQRIFPTVEKLDVLLSKVYDKYFVVVIRIKEKGVNTWIEQPDMSSGMFRALMQITTLVLANDGDVIMIDEFENGLGVNCINELADLIMEPEADIQVVMTSHHPYIINAIPVKDWKILTRNGSNVHVHTAEELHIGEHSKHEAFMQLLQTPEYKTGINRN